MGRKTANIADELDSMAGGNAKAAAPEQSGDIAAELDGYSAPDPRDKPTKIATLETQEEVANFVKDMGLFLGQGAVRGAGDELVGRMQGPVGSPEYLQARDQARKKIQDKREEYPVLAPVAEAAGAIATTAPLPIAGGWKAALEIADSALQGAGESLEQEDMAGDAGRSALWATGLQAGGKLLKEAVFDNPTKILSRSMGVTQKDVKGDLNSKALRSIKKLKDAGFFKQGEVTIDPSSQKWKRSATNLAGMFKPQTMDTLKERITASKSLLSDRNVKLLSNKKVPGIEVQRAIHEGIQEFSYDPYGMDIDARAKLAYELQEVLLSDLKKMTGWKFGDDVPAKEVEIMKRKLDAYIGSSAFKKKADDLGIDAESMVKFRTKLDDLLDSPKVGGSEYKKNNDTLSALLSLEEVMDYKLGKDYLDTGSGLVDMRNLPTQIMEFISPTPVDIARAGLAGSKTAQAAGSTLLRAPVEKQAERTQIMPEVPFAPQEEQAPEGYNFSKVKPAFEFGREPQGFSDVNPMMLAKMKLPRSSTEWIKNKDVILQKLASAQVPPEMLDATFEAMNSDHGKLDGIATTIAMTYPELFTSSKYNMFDGIIIDPNERARAADDTSKRDDLGSLQKAKIIRELNKSGKWLGE